LRLVDHWSKESYRLCKILETEEKTRVQQSIVERVVKE
jgi:hypothetical protein